MASRPVVLVLEDNPELLEAYERTLTSLGCDVVAVECPAEAWPHLEEGLKPTFIMSELQMPDMDGDEFCTLVRAQYPKIPFYLVSGSTEVYVRARLCGATHAFMKIITQDTLRELITGVYAA